MFIYKYLSAFWNDWVALMSGLASVIFTFWTALVEPTNAGIRLGLWFTALICFVVASYRVWMKEHNEVILLQEKIQQDSNPVIREFEAIKINILTSGLIPEIDSELSRLKSLLHKNSSLLKRSDVAGFYKSWIAPKEYHLKFGAELGFSSNEYKTLKEQLALIDLRSDDIWEMAVTSDNVK